MRTLILIALILALSRFSLSVSGPAQKDLSQNLKYYRRYEALHGKQINPKIPLRQHYHNERNVRKALYGVNAAIHKVKERDGFKIRDLKRAALRIKNKIDRVDGALSADERVDSQRIQAIKEQINHDEKFREIYKRRLIKNRNLELHALPDQKASYDKLIHFDSTRMTHWRASENKEQLKLNDEKQKTIDETNETDQNLSNLRAKLMKIEASKKSVERDEKWKMARLLHEQSQLQGTLDNMVTLDRERVANQAKEAHTKIVAEKKKILQ